MKNDPLYTSCKEYCKVALDSIKQVITSRKEQSINLVKKTEYTDKIGLLPSIDTNINILLFVLRNEDNLKKTRSYQLASQALKEDKEIARHLNRLVGTAEMRSRIDTETCLRGLFIGLLREQKGLDFQESVFNDVYARFENYFYDSSLPYRCFSLLINFESTQEKIELGSGFSIIRLSKEQKEELLSQTMQPLGIKTRPYSTSSNYAFELFVRVPKVIGDSSATPSTRGMPFVIARENMDKASSALRLFKNGALHYDQYIEVEPTAWDFSLGRSATYRIAIQPPAGAKYELSDAETLDFLVFWKSFQLLKRHNSKVIDIALSRFNFAYERIRPEDRLIDYVIGFESLLLKGDEKGEFAYRLALRGTMLLSTSSDKRKVIYDLLKEAYRERSRIVHGVGSSKTVSLGEEKITFHAFVDKVEQHLRSMIMEFIKRSETQNTSTIIDSLDLEIINGHITDIH